MSENIKWICPYCQSRLDNNLKCVKCSYSGVREDDIYYIHRFDESWEKCLIERNGWINILKKKKQYFDNPDHYLLPDGNSNLKRVFGHSQLHLDKFLEVENLNNKVCLDLGAWIGWVEIYILKKYPLAKLIALEINDDHLVGLKRSNDLKKFFHLNFISLVADMHYIPIKSNSVDIIYSCDALHHFRSLDKVFAEIERVLKPNGKFYALNEPDRPEGTDEQEYLKPFALEEEKFNIIERRPTLSDYLKEGKALNLQAQSYPGLIKNIDTHGLFLLGKKTSKNILVNFISSKLHF